MLDDRQLRNVRYEFAESGSYVGIVGSLPNDSFKFGLVGNIERDRCAIVCISKIRSGAY